MSRGELEEAALMRWEEKGKGEPGRFAFFSRRKMKWSIWVTSERSESPALCVETRKFIDIRAWSGCCSSGRIMSDTMKRPLPPGFPVPKQETERLLIERLQNSKTEDDYFRWLLFVVAFYRGIEKVESARALLQLFLESAKDHEQKAHCHLALGQIATDEQRMETALNHFMTALRFNPTKAKVGYVLHNNVSYCFNQLGRFKDAERHCHAAIEIDSRRASAYRNLGISLAGQQDGRSAVWALVEAVKMDPSDERAREFLKKLLAQDPDLLLQCPWIVESANPSGNAVDTLPT